ncbi:MAG: hypothetical protein JWO06_3907 [Bacteroidota bacterium]|nr:hypothetical protein [Bacteroidota bacterium]
MVTCLKLATPGLIFALGLFQISTMKTAKIFDLSEKISKLIGKEGFPNLSKIEYDLLMQHTRDFYEELATLEITPVDKEKTGEMVKEPVAKRTFQSNRKLLLDETVIETVEKVVVKAPPIPIRDEPAIVSKTITNAKSDGSSTINESIKHPGSLNEKLKSSAPAEVHKKFATKPLKDLIDLNKRFVLLNELFKGNGEAYSSAITHIDSTGNYEEADAFIKSQLVTNYFWDESSQTSRMFMKLVKQKFGVE